MAGLQGHHERSRVTLAAQPAPGWQAGKGPAWRPALPAPGGVRVRSCRAGDLRARRGRAAGGPPPLHPLCPVRISAGRREAWRRPSPPFPHPRLGETPGQPLHWEPLTHTRVLEVLHNPTYAGTYVYGRTQTRTRVLPGEAPRVKGRTRRVARQDWPIVLHAQHPAYITWEQFLRHQQQLDDNGTFRPEERPGAVREGTALLQGLVLCGQCGRRMRVRYIEDGTTPSYDCNTLHVRQAGPTCQSLRGDGVDAAVARVFLDAMQPAQLAISLATLEQVEAQARQIERQWHLRLERAQYEADLARRRFLAVDPEYRLVARTLERDWNEKLAALAALEREYATMPPLTARLVSPEERQRILALAQDVPAVWAAATTSHPERKQLLRCLMKDVTLTKRATTITVAIRWQTEACTLVEIPPPPPDPARCRCPHPYPGPAPYG